MVLCGALWRQQVVGKVACGTAPPPLRHKLTGEKPPRGAGRGSAWRAGQYDVGGRGNLWHIPVCQAPPRGMVARVLRCKCDMVGGSPVMPHHADGVSH